MNLLSLPKFSEKFFNSSLKKYEHQKLEILSTNRQYTLFYKNNSIRARASKSKQQEQAKNKLKLAIFSQYMNY